MVRRQHDQIIDPRAIQQPEEVAQIAIQREQLEAHLRPFRAVAVANDVGAGQADGDYVRGCAPSKLHPLDQGGGQRQSRTIEFRSSSKRAGVACLPRERSVPATSRT